jgi:CRP/FNR family transcriptional regulator, dissimilatory nitrate respiration regulator
MDLLTFETLPIALQQAIYTRELQAGQRLFRQGDAATALFLVEAGRLRLARSTINQQTVGLQVVSTGQSAGDAALFSTIYSYSAIAEVDSRVIVFPKQELVAALREFPDLAEAVIARLLEKINLLEINLELKGIRSAHQRLLRYFQFLATSEPGNVVQLDRTWKEIAEELGFTPDTISRALAKLERDSRISRDQQRITLHDLSAA